MRRAPEQIDEYILAAYLSGELPTRLRKEIAAYLAENTRARELLGMATDALEVIESGDGAPPQLAFPAGTDEGATGTGEETRGPAESASPLDNPTLRRSADNNRFLWRIVGLVTVAILVLAVTLAIHLFLVQRAGSTYATESVNNGWEPVVEVDQLAVSWPSVPDAESYQILLYDPVRAIVVSSIETTGTTFNGFLDGVEYAPALAGGKLQIWIEAFGAGGSYLQASKRVTISFK